MKTITIGNAVKDKDLIPLILSYQKERGLPSAADAVRALCKDALEFKKLVKN